MKQKKLLLTDAQEEAFDALLAATGETFADMVRRLIEIEAQRHNITFPQDMPPKPTLDEVRHKRWKKSE